MVNLDAAGTVWRVNQAAYTPTEVTRGYASLDNIAEPEIRSIRHFLPDKAGVRKARRTLHAKAISIAAVFATGYYLAVIGNRHPLLHLAGIVLIAHACVAAAVSASVRPPRDKVVLSVSAYLRLVSLLLPHSQVALCWRLWKTSV